MRRTLTIVACLMLAGCDDPQQVEGLKNTLAQTRAAVLHLEEQVAALPEGEDRDATVAKLAEMQAVIATLEAKVAEMGETIGAEDVAIAVAPSLPPPWNIVVTVAGTLIGAWAGAAKKKADAAKVIKAIEAAKSADGVVNFTDPTTRDKLKTMMGESGRALVNSIR